MERRLLVRSAGCAAATLLVTVAFGMPVQGTSNATVWALGRMFGSWTIETTPGHKGHSPAGMHAVCVNSISDEVRLVPITARQAYGEPGTRAGALESGAPCPSTS